jgi:hypothetical protein
MRTTAFLLTAVLVATVGVLPAGPAAGAATVIRVAGDFIGDERDEIFEYRPGNGLDLMYTEFVKAGAGIASGPTYTLPVTYTYTPFTGDFDGDGKDELFFFGAGDAGDFIWDFNGIAERREVAKTQGGLYHPVVGDFDDNGTDDVFWYAPGAVADQLWTFPPGGGLAHVSVPVRNFTGDYVPLAGDFNGTGGTDIILYGRGDDADHLVDFATGFAAPTISAFGPITGPGHRPVALDAFADGWTDILFYNVASTVDPLWNLRAGGKEVHDERITGTYAPVAGDFLGDGYEDVFWYGSVSSFVWDWEGATHPTVRTGGVS